MLISDLIKELQTIEVNHDRDRYDGEGADILGPAVVVIDCWEDGKYKGWSPEITFNEIDPGDYIIRWVGW